MSAPLPILYQDDALVVVAKPSGLLVHRTALARGETRFALQLLRNQLGRHVYPVHRLDRPTSGVLVFALSSEIARTLGEAFAEQRVSKRYLAVVRGLGPEAECLDYALREEDGRRPKAEMPAMEAATEVQRLDSVELPVRVDRYPSARYSLMEARPQTGRRHQIRRHLSRRGYPIIGDARHGKGNHNRFFSENLDTHRLLLAAVEMSLEHPVSGERLSVTAGLEDDMTRLFARFGWSAHLPRHGYRLAAEPNSAPSTTRAAMPTP